MRIPRFPRPAVFAVAAAILSAGVGVSPGASLNDAVGPAIELPIFEVTDSRELPPPEKWRYAEIPGFEILTNLSDRASKRFLNDFLLLQEVNEIILPLASRLQAGVPTLLVLCGRGNAFDSFLPPDRASQSLQTNSLFFQDREHTGIAVDFALAEMTFAGGAVTEETDSYHAFYEEYFRYLIRRLAGSPPPWFEEGLVQLYSGVDFDRKTIDFARIGDGFGGSKTGDFNRIIAAGGPSTGGDNPHQMGLRLLPMAEIFGERPTDPDTLRIWRAESYAFVHRCLYGNGKRLQPAFLRFVERLMHEPPSEALFKDCFKMSYKDMTLELRSYAEFTAHESVRYQMKKGQPLPAPPEATLREATGSEVGRIKGEMLRLGSHPDQAHLELIAPYIRGERDPRLLAALGLDEQAAGHSERARKFLEAAAVAKVKRPRAYVGLARLRLAEALAAPSTAGGKLGDGQLQTVLEPLLVARGQRPPMPEVYAAIAEAWTHSASPPARENFDIVMEGVRKFPRNTDLLLQATLLATGGGYPQDAAALAAQGEKVSADPATQSRFTMLAEALRRDTAQSASPIQP